MTERRVDIKGTPYLLRAEPPRTSLTDEAHTLWGFNVEVLRDGLPVCIKTCFVGRVSVQARAPEALEGTAKDIAAVVHDFAFLKVAASLESDDLEDGIVFA